MNYIPDMAIRHSNAQSEKIAAMVKRDLENGGQAEIDASEKEFDAGGGKVVDLELKPEEVMRRCRDIMVKADALADRDFVKELKLMVLYKTIEHVLEQGDILSRVPCLDLTREQYHLRNALEDLKTDYAHVKSSWNG